MQEGNWKGIFTDKQRGTAWALSYSTLITIASQNNLWGCRHTFTWSGCKSLEFCDVLNLGHIKLGYVVTCNNCKSLEYCDIFKLVCIKYIYVK